MTQEQALDIGELTALAQASARVTGPCTCEIASYAGWTRIPVSFPQAQMRPAGTLAGDPYAEPTYTEYHPHGTNYWSPDAPIALHYFPYNRCAVQQCEACRRYCLTYVEAGGYYVEPRIRALDARHIVDVPAAD